MKKNNNKHNEEENIDSVPFEELKNEIVDENIDNEQDTEQSTNGQSEQDNWEEKYNTLNDSYLRLMAEYDNYRRRTMKEKTDLIKNGGESVVLSILPTVDNFERAVKSMETATEISAVKEGVELIYQQLMSALKQQGVKEIETENKDFDTEFHEAITTIPAPSDDLKDKIIDCTQKGYLLNDKVIRHSKVVVSQ